MTHSSESAGRVAPEIRLQQAYYARTATHYDDWHLDEDIGHAIALAFLDGAIRQRQWSSLLDVGAGTGRVMAYLAETQPLLRSKGVEPVEELRRQGYAKGIPETDLVAGDGGRLDFADGSFDVVCAFGVLHHVRRPTPVVAEMLRVARKAIFISDSNNFGQGGVAARTIKQACNLFSLWPVIDFIKTKGRGFTESEGDGIAYSYSLFNHEPMIRRSCREVFLMNTRPAGRDLYRSADSVAILGIK